jgi:mitotic spindle assembly checkpoint protein MAD1
MSKEFLEAVYCLLGWRIKFDEKGVLLTPMYARKGLKLRFTSNEGHWGTMSMTGRLAKGLEDVKQYWVVDRNSIPGFLSQVTLEIFEKTTVGVLGGCWALKPG